MTERHIEFETAKLAKEKKFQWTSMRFIKDDQTFKVIHEGWGHSIYGNTCFNKEGEKITPKMYNPTLEHYPRPTQSLLQKWLRDVHFIDIQILRNKPGYNEYMVEIYIVPPEQPEYIHFHVKYEDGVYIRWFSSYEEALEIGLQEALKRI